jgi:hypothetical protein
MVLLRLWRKLYMHAIALLISLHLMPATVIGPPTPIKYVQVAPNHDVVRIPHIVVRANRSEVRQPLVTSTYDSAPHTHAGLVAWSSALPYPWPQIIRCESLRDDSWRPGSSSMARGVFQFLRSTWSSLGLYGDPAEASWRDQYHAALRLRERDGINSWDCARITGVS